MYRKILLATDFSEASKYALAHAVDAARRDQAELHVLHVEVLHAYSLEGESLPTHERFEQALRQASRDALDGLDLPSDLRVVKRTERDVSAAPAILNYAMDNGVDLIVVGSHGRTGLSRWFLGSVAQEVVRASPVPVLVAGSGPAHALPKEGPVRILAPVDFSDPSKAAFRAAASLASARKAHLIVMHSIDMTRFPPYFPAELESAERGQVRKELDDLLAGAPAGIETVICDGRAEDRIVDMARDHGVHLIVIGTTGHGTLDRLLLGSVTERVLRSAPCPVLAYREFPPAVEQKATATGR